MSAEHTCSAQKSRPCGCEERAKNGAIQVFTGSTFVGHCPTIFDPYREAKCKSIAVTDVRVLETRLCDFEL